MLLRTSCLKHVINWAGGWPCHWESGCNIFPTVRWNCQIMVECTRDECRRWPYRLAKENRPIGDRFIPPSRALFCDYKHTIEFDIGYHWAGRTWRPSRAKLPGLPFVWKHLFPVNGKASWDLGWIFRTMNLMLRSLRTVESILQINSRSSGAESMLPICWFFQNSVLSWISVLSWRTGKKQWPVLWEDIFSI